MFSYSLCPQLNVSFKAWLNFYFQKTLMPTCLCYSLMPRITIASSLPGHTSCLKGTAEGWL